MSDDSVQGRPELDEWRGHAEARTWDAVVVACRCAGCGAFSSSLSEIDQAPYDSMPTLEAWAGTSVGPYLRPERCSCGGQNEGVVSYHTFSTALRADLVFRYALQPGPLARLRGPKAQLQAWSARKRYFNLSPRARARAEATVSADARLRRWDVAVARGDGLTVLQAMQDVFDVGGFAAVEPYVEALLQFTEHPADAELLSPAQLSPREREVRDTVERLARETYERDPGPQAAYDFGDVVRLRYEIGDRDRAALERVLPALDAFPDDPRCQAIRALASRHLGDYAEAARRYRQMCAGSEPLGARFDFGLNALDSSDADLLREALGFFEEGQEELSTDASYALLKARLHLALNEVDRASEWLEVALGLEPDLLKEAPVVALPDYLSLVQLTLDEPSLI